MNVAGHQEVSGPWPPQTHTAHKLREGAAEPRGKDADLGGLGAWVARKAS